MEDETVINGQGAYIDVLERRKNGYYTVMRYIGKRRLTFRLTAKRKKQAVDKFMQWEELVLSHPVDFGDRFHRNFKYNIGSHALGIIPMNQPGHDPFLRLSLWDKEWRKLKAWKEPHLVSSPSDISSIDVSFCEPLDCISAITLLDDECDIPIGLFNTEDVLPANCDKKLQMAFLLGAL